MNNKEEAEVMRSAAKVFLLSFCLVGCFVICNAYGQGLGKGFVKEKLPPGATVRKSASDIIVTINDVDMPDRDTQFLDNIRAQLNRPIVGGSLNCTADGYCEHTIMVQVTGRKDIDSVIDELRKMNLGNISVPELKEGYSDPVNLTVYLKQKEKVYYDPPAPAVVIEKYDDNCRCMFELAPGPGPDYYGTPGSLHKAAWKGDLERVRQHLNKRENVNATSRYGFTPLFLAADSGHLEAARLLIEQGADVNAKNSDGFTPLYGAVLSRNEALVKLLLEKGAKVNVESVTGHTPFELSVCGPVEIAELFLKHGSYTKTKNQVELNALFHRFLLRGRAQDMAKIAELFTSYGADVNARNNFRAEFMNYDAYGDSPLHAVARRRDGGSEAVEVLIRKGADINAKDDAGHTPLQLCVASRNYQVAESLLKNGADIKVRDKSGKTVLHWAAQEGSYNMSKMLIKYEAPVNAKDNNGLTPLHLTVPSDSLFRSGRAFLKKGKKPAGLSAYAGHYEIAELLLKKGADINAVSNGGITPLNLAAQKGYYRMVELFLKKGADVNIADKNGCAPLCTATKKGDKDIIELLESYSAKK
ncbi:MAG: ankyrin repeat domain-containing protein [Candidatus Omnitrophica bacterium]|nr:ankyrin repeat domain-containing protein [Candidatus Omnitrophota bacterium]